VLEDANTKLASVTTNVVGVPGRAMLEALLEGSADPVTHAKLAQECLHSKRAEFTAALEGRFRPHHVALLRRMLELLYFLEEAIVVLMARWLNCCALFSAGKGTGHHSRR
jgi:hypothetical protein